MTEEALQSERFYKTNQISKKKKRTEKRSSSTKIIRCVRFCWLREHTKIKRRTGVRTNTLTIRIKVGNIRCKTNEKIKHNSEIKKVLISWGQCVCPLNSITMLFSVAMFLPIFFILVDYYCCFHSACVIFIFFVSPGFSPHTTSPSSFHFTDMDLRWAWTSPIYANGSSPSSQPFCLRQRHVKC